MAQTNKFQENFFPFEENKMDNFSLCINGFDQGWFEVG
jgi:hypothetical protein